MKKARHLPLFAATIRNKGRMKQVGKNIKRVLVHIPKDFLEEFDREIAGLYASRNEAIRAGMIMVIEAEKRRGSEK
jgi:hypothetical protein